MKPSAHRPHESPAAFRGAKPPGEKPPRTKPRPPRRRGVRIAAIAIAAIAALVLGLHVFLPPVILAFVNRELAKIPDTHAHIDDLDISLLRGAYTLDGVTFQKIRGDDTLPLFSARHVDFSVEWGALFQGKLVSEITLTEPRLTLTPSPPAKTGGKPFDFAALRKTIESFFPFTINRFAIENGAIHFQDSSRSPPVDIRLDRMEATARGLTNAQETGKGVENRNGVDVAAGDAVENADENAGAEKRNKPADAGNPRALPASFHLTARAMGHAPLIVNLGLAPLAEHPTFDLDAELKSLDLTTLNPFFRAYADIDVERGTFSVFTEVAAAEGRFRGYVKPLTKDIKILDLDKDEGSMLSLAWEALVAGAARLLENPPEVQVGTRIGFRGSFQDPQADLWETVAYLLRNAFIRALQPGLENSIELEGGPTLEEEKTQKRKERARS